MKQAWFRALSGAAVIVIGMGTQTAWAAPGGSSGNDGRPPAEAGRGNDDEVHGNGAANGNGGANGGGNGAPAERGNSAEAGQPNGNGHGRPEAGEQPASRGRDAGAGESNGNGHGRPEAGEQPSSRGSGNAGNTPAATAGGNGNGNGADANRGNGNGADTNPGNGASADRGSNDRNQAPAARRDAGTTPPRTNGGNGAKAANVDAAAAANGAAGNGIGGGTPHDPPGNNGTIKTHEPGDAGPGNDPHMAGCSVQLDGYGFDSGQTLDVSFSLHAPTGSGVVLTDQLTADGDGNGNDGTRLDATKVYDLSTALTTSGFEPHPKQGYHVRVTVDGKHKMVWLPCTPAPQPTGVRRALGTATPATVTPDVTPAAAMPAVVSPTFLSPAPIEPQLLQADGWTAVVSVPDAPSVLAAGAVVPGETKVLGAVFERPGGGGTARVLAFTGMSMLPGLVAAVVLLLAGSAMVAAGRRRTEVEAG